MCVRIPSGTITTGNRPMFVEWDSKAVVVATTRSRIPK